MAQRRVLCKPVCGNPGCAGNAETVLSPARRGRWRQNRAAAPRLYRWRPADRSTVRGSPGSWPVPRFERGEPFAEALLQQVRRAGQHRFAFGGGAQEDLAPVALPPLPGDETGCHQPVDQRGDGRLAEMQRCRDGAGNGFRRRWISCSTRSWEAVSPVAVASCRPPRSAARRMRRSDRSARLVIGSFTRADLRWTAYFLKRNIIKNMKDVSGLLAVCSNPFFLTGLEKS